MLIIDKEFARNRQMINTSFLNVPMEAVPFTALIAGIEVESSIHIAESIQHLYSVKKIITLNEYRSLLKAIFNKPLGWKHIDDKILVPKAAKQKVDIEEELRRINDGEQSDHHTEPLDEDTVELVNDLNNENNEHQRKMEQEERQSLELIARLQKQEMEGREKSEAEGEDCEICMVGLYQQNAEPFPLEKCGHVFHTECLRSCMNALISERKFPLVCPSEACAKEVIERDIGQILSMENLEKYQEFTFKNYLDMNSDTVSWCPTAGCKYVFFFSPEDPIQFQCEQCKKQYCLACKVEWHRNMTCKEYQISNNFSAEDQKFMKFVTGHHYKQCPKCKFFVEKTMGCDHMVCRCKYQFCYKCGGKYMDCDCTRQNQRRMEERRQNAEKRRQKKRLRMEALEEKKRKKRDDSDNEEADEDYGRRRSTRNRR